MPVGTKENKIKEPNLNVELFWSVFKVMAALIVFVIIVFGGLLLHYINKTTTLTTHSIEMTQDGQDNNQSLTYTGNRVPQVDADAALELYRRVSRATAAGLVNSLSTPALGGLGIAFAKCAMAGRLGMEIDLEKIPCEACSALEVWFSESNSRFIATVPEKNREAFEAIFDGVPCAAVGKVTADKYLKATGRGADWALELEALLSNYKKTLDRV